MKSAIFFLLIASLAGCSTLPGEKVKKTAPQVTFGKTPLSIAIDKDTIGYYDASAEVLYTDDKNKERVLTAMKVQFLEPFYRISRGHHFTAQGSYFYIKQIRPFAALPLDMPLDQNDAKTTANFICTLFEAGSCSNKLESASPDANVAFSFEVPLYGMSGCLASTGNTCVSWFGEETVTQYKLPGCQGASSQEKVQCLVCSMP
jgi:hypothetical protein